jgi:uncharacterized Zn finger protein (UPF0148 family)
MAKHFSKLFMTTKYKEHQENVLFEREQGFMPATQGLLERRVKIAEKRTEIVVLERRIVAIHDKKRRLLEEIYALGRNRNIERRQFISPCPSNDCRGFLSTQLKCGTCNIWVCGDCREIKGLFRDVEHTCSPEMLETARLISSETKPCPKCGTRIFKISGCNQMYCTNCDTGFDWVTLNIIERMDRFHNPHYFERLFAQRNAAADGAVAEDDVAQYQPQPCRENRYVNSELSRTIFRIINRRFPNFDTDPELTTIKDSVKYISGLIRSIIHIHLVEMGGIAPARPEIIEHNQELRIDYMMGKISEDVFKVLIQRNEKKQMKQTELYQVYELVVVSCSDVIYRYVDGIRNTTGDTYDDSMIRNEIPQVIEYANQCLTEINRTYQSKMRLLKPDLSF